MKPLFAFLMALLALWGCQKDDAAPQYVNQGNIPLNEYEELIALCDTAALLSFAQFDGVIARIQQIFADHGDARGAFPTVYKAITTAAVNSLADGAYEDESYSNKFALDFSKRYLYFLKSHLLNEPLEFHWEEYYRHALEGHHITRMVLEGINAHLTIDLTRALAHTGVYPDFQDDWILFGDITVQSVPGFLDELQAEYHTDGSDVFGVFFIGDIIDAIFGEGTAVHFGFNLLRVDAFDRALALQDPQRAHRIEADMARSYHERQALIALVDELGLTPRLGAVEGAD